MGVIEAMKVSETSAGSRNNHGTVCIYFSFGGNLYAYSMGNNVVVGYEEKPGIYPVFSE